MGSAIRVNFYRPSYKNNLNDIDQDKLHIAILEYFAVPKLLKEIMDKYHPSFIEKHIKGMLFDSLEL